MRFDGHWRERVVLRDGRHAVLRLLRPDDRPRLVNGFGELSEEGRYRRFLAAKTTLSDAELDYLTDVDQSTHVAIGAAQMDGDVEGRGLGVARYIVFPDRPTVADAAVTVVDEAQGVGLGTLLFHRLTEAALERGVHRFAGEVLAKNDAMLSIMRHVTNEPADVSHGVATIEFTLPGAEGNAPEPVIRTRGHGIEVLKLAAEKVMGVRRFLAWIESRSEPGSDSGSDSESE